MMSCEFRHIESANACAFLIGKHYSGRKPQIKYAFGLFENDELVAVCTYGVPASRPLCVGVMGAEYFNRVIELNRLCRLDDCKTNMSKFVSWTLKQIKKHNLLVVSYADKSMGHIGSIYQACNFLYTGDTKERTDKYTEGNKHPRHYKEENQHLRKVRSSKHRYIYFACSKGFKKLFKSKLKYKIIETFPKGDNKYYKLGDFQQPIVVEKETGQRVLI